MGFSFLFFNKWQLTSGQIFLPFDTFCSLICLNSLNYYVSLFSIFLVDSLFSISGKGSQRHTWREGFPYSLYSHFYSFFALCICLFSMHISHNQLLIWVI